MGIEGSKNTEMYPEGIVGGDNELVLLNPSKNSKLKGQTPSSSSSSDSSSEEDFFQLDANELRKPIAQTADVPSNTLQLPPKLGEGAQLEFTFDARGDNKKVPDHLSTKFGGVSLSVEANMLYEPIISDQVLKGNAFSHNVSGVTSGFADNYSLLGLPTQSLPIQAIAKLETPDPYRIPASVFARSKSSTPADWSVASNESLFSIHVGNASFSRDHVFLLGKSEELGFPSDGFLPSSVMVDSESNNLDFGEGLEVPSTSESLNAETMENIQRRAAAAEDVNEKMPHADLKSFFHSTSSSRLSDGSATSTRSFAFPINSNRSELAVNKERIDVVKSKRLTGEENISSLKMEHEQLRKHQSQLKLRSHEAIPNAAKTKWFACFSCRSFCC